MDDVQVKMRDAVAECLVVQLSGVESPIERVPDLHHLVQM
jgi:hypothetical protein